MQVHFGARQEIATESDARYVLVYIKLASPTHFTDHNRVSALCTEWEMVLTHGAKKPKPKNALRLTGRSEGVSLWPLAKLCVSIEDLQRFSRLNHVTTELGRGRAWLRASINERTLEIYMHTALAHEEQLRYRLVYNICQILLPVFCCVIGDSMNLTHSWLTRKEAACFL